MTKLISPLLFRFKNMPNYLNRIHLKLIYNENYLTYFKFFNILLNFIYLFKLKIEKYKLFKKKFINLACNYYDFYTIHISLFFYRLRYRELFYLHKNILKLSNYINYFLKLYNFYKPTNFIFIYVKRFRKNDNKICHIITSIKNFIKLYKNFKIKIIHFINSLFSKKIKKNEKNLQGIKCVYSGCLYKNSKKKSFKYSKGNTSTSILTSNILYTKKILKTRQGIVGVKVWINI